MDPYFRSKLFFNSTTLLLLCLIAPSQCRADSSPLGYCSGANYRKQSSASGNVKTVLKTLISASTKSGAYSTSAAGHGAYRIHGLLQCRDDATATQCHSCTAEASELLESACAGKPGGRVWLDLCYLRFHNSSFAGHVDKDPPLFLIDTQNVSDPESFRRSMQGLMNNLSKKAVDDGDRFSAGSTPAAAKPRIYGLVQCTGDLSLRHCSRCLKNVLGRMYNFPAGRQGARMLTGSCIARYETYSFFNLSSASATAAPSSPSMAPASSPTPAAASSVPSPSSPTASASAPAPSPSLESPPSPEAPESSPPAEPPTTPPPSSHSPESPPPPSHAPAPGSAPGTSGTPPPATSGKTEPREAFTWVVALVSIVAHALYALC